MDKQISFLDQLFDRGILYDSDVDGLYARSGIFEEVIARFEELAKSFGKDETSEAMVFPPGLPMKDFETSGYMKNFPQLAGTVHAFCGNDHDHASLLQCLAAGDDWTKDQKSTDIALTPAACYPLYPILARRGPLPATGAYVTCNPIAIATSRRASRPACRCSACANSCASAAASRRSNSARRG